jgi:hypothetical protein
VTTFLRTNSKFGTSVAISSDSLQSVWGRLCSMENGNQNSWSDSSPSLNSGTSWTILLIPRN